MKHSYKAAQAVAGFLLLASMHASGVTINWGSPVVSQFVNSEGQALDSSYKVELGVFVNSFVPTSENTAEWSANWRTFSAGAFNLQNGYFTGTADLKGDGSSSDVLADIGVNYSDLEAYVWVFNSDTMQVGSEWFLGRSDSWVLPSASPGCCDGRTPLNWSTSDLNVGDTPVFGGQGVVSGGGTVIIPGNYVLQTYTVPEPSVLLLGSSAVVWSCLRRRRKAD